MIGPGSVTIMRVRRGITSSQPMDVSLRLGFGWAWQRRVLGENGTVVSKSVTKDRRPPFRTKENLGIMRFHSVSTGTVHAFVTDLDIPGPVMTPNDAHLVAGSLRSRDRLLSCIRYLILC